jgi:site-specific recombinase XerD
MYNEKVLKEFKEHLLLEKNRSIHTADNYIRDLQQFSNFLKGKDFRKVDPFNISGFIIYLREQNMSSRTTNRKLSSIKQFYKFLQKRGHIAMSPAENIEGAKQEERLPQPVDYEDIEAIFSVIPEEDLRAKVIFEILYGTGARRFEVAKIRVRDVNFNRKYIRIIGKGSKERIVPVSDYLLSLIKKLIVQNGNSTWLFPSRQYPGKCISTRRINEIVSYYVKKAGLDDKNITPHKFRHSFCSHLHEGGADLKTIQALAGHSKADTTNLYTKISSSRTMDEYINAHPRARLKAQ